MTCRTAGPPGKWRQGAVGRGTLSSPAWACGARCGNPPFSEHLCLSPGPPSVLPSSCSVQFPGSVARSAQLLLTPASLCRSGSRPPSCCHTGTSRALPAASSLGKTLRWLTLCHPGSRMSGVPACLSKGRCPSLLSPVKMRSNGDSTRWLFQPCWGQQRLESRFLIPTNVGKSWRMSPSFSLPVLSPTGQVTSSLHRIRGMTRS